MSSNKAFPISPANRYWRAIVTVVMLIACIGGAMSIPYFFESPSMYYKFGMDKLLLRLAKMVGWAAGVLLLL